MPACVIAGDVMVSELHGVRCRARGVRVESFRETEVEHFHGAVGADLDVGRLEIAMDDALLMRRLERLRDLLRDRQRLVEWNRATRDALRQIVALDEFHHEGGDARTFFEPVDGGNVRMIQRREDFGLALKARQSVGISGKRGRQDLDGDLTFQLRVRRPIHLAHTAFADRRGDFVDAERVPGAGPMVA